MSALLLRRALLLVVPLALVLAACGGGEGKPGVPSGVGDTNPAAGERPEVATGFQPCTAQQVLASVPCRWDAGSVCTIDGGHFLPWTDRGPIAPKITWTYPCAPDHFSVTLAPW